MSCLVFVSTSAIGLLIAYFVKISKEGKRRDAVEESFEMKCPITAEESQQLANENNIKYRCCWSSETSLSFFSYFSRILKENYPEEMTVSEFRKVMLEVLSSGGISEVECMNTLDRLFERLESNRCEYHDGEKVNMEDVNKAYVDESDHIRYQEWEELENVKIPVKTLLMAVMHTVHGRNEDRAKAIFRLFKE